ncbi:hypothetical protein YH65_01540 [Sulfurovum lithotrophicum]|uniref:Type II secretion system protein n=1 Tax=Sulfurovum lithotrophicum TaxID=206403 RepID=A0A7U4LZT0_9BACT|nr:hypothetical protein YH65_01540 [Sulfurovum lithotrophicum]
MKSENCEHNMKQMRRGFTMIELIFVIVIIGLLAGIAIKKLSATRDDAKLSAVVSNMSICITDAAAHYTATHRDYTLADHPVACDKNSTMCYNIVYSVNGEDFNVTTDPTAAPYCTDIDYVGGHLARSYDFGGIGVNRN